MSKNEIVALSAGKMLSLRPANGADCVAAALVAAEPQDGAGLLMDFQRHTQIFPKLKDIQITPLGESRYRLRSLVKSGPFSFRFTTLWAYDAGTHTATFDLDPEDINDFEQYRGYWKFVPQKNRKTLVLYSIKNKTKDNPLAFVEDALSRKEMLNTLGEFKKALLIS